VASGLLCYVNACSYTFFKEIFTEKKYGVKKCISFPFCKDMYLGEIWSGKKDSRWTLPEEEETRYSNSNSYSIQIQIQTLNWTELR
jgi:hypothetical protein